TSGRRAANGKIALKVPPDVITAQCARYRKHGKPWHRPRLQNLDGYEIGRVNPNWPHRSPLIRLHLSVAPGLEFSFDLAPALSAWIAASQKLAAGLPPSGPGAGGPGGMPSSAWRSAWLSWPVASPRASMRAGRV